MDPRLEAILAEELGRKEMTIAQLVYQNELLRAEVERLKAEPRTVVSRPTRVPEFREVG